MDFKVQIEGYEELNKRMDTMVRALSSDQVKPILLEGARDITETARMYAPLGPTGNLKKSLQSISLPTTGNLPPVVVAKVNRRRAPHAHLLEYGTNERIAKRGKYRGRRFGTMKAQPFFWPAVQGRYEIAFRNILTKLSALIDRL